MEALIVVLVMHCNVVEAVILDDPTRLRIVPVTVEQRAGVMEQYEIAKAAGARTDMVHVEQATGEKCKVGT